MGDVHDVSTRIGFHVSYFYPQPPRLKPMHLSFLVGISASHALLWLSPHTRYQLSQSINLPASISVICFGKSIIVEEEYQDLAIIYLL